MSVEHDRKRIFDKIISNFSQLEYVVEVYVEQWVVVFHCSNSMNDRQNIYYSVSISNSNVEKHFEHVVQEL